MKIENGGERCNALTSEINCHIHRVRKSGTEAEGIKSGKEREQETGRGIVSGAG